MNEADRIWRELKKLHGGVLYDPSWDQLVIKKRNWPKALPIITAQAKRKVLKGLIKEDGLWNHVADSTRLNHLLELMAIQLKSLKPPKGE